MSPARYLLFIRQSFDRTIKPLTLRFGMETARLAAQAARSLHRHAGSSFLLHGSVSVLQWISHRLGAYAPKGNGAVSSGIPPVDALANGHIRRLQPADKALFRDHLLRLDAETRRSRFAMNAHDSFLENYAETAFSLDTTIFAHVEDGLIRATGELRHLPHEQDGPVQAEAAFCVEDGWRQRGIGTRLMELALLEAEAIGIRRMYINCLATNRKMQALARKFGANLTFAQGDVIGILQPGHQETHARLTDTRRTWTDMAIASSGAERR